MAARRYNFAVSLHRLQQALHDYPCGPGGHRASYGMGLSQIASATCAVCFKRMSAADCLFCAAPGEGPPCTIAGPMRSAEGRLCRLCREAIASSEEWELMAEGTPTA